MSKTRLFTRLAYSSLNGNGDHQNKKRKSPVTHLYFTLDVNDLDSEYYLV